MMVVFFCLDYETTTYEHRGYRPTLDQPSGASPHHVRGSHSGSGSVLGFAIDQGDQWISRAFPALKQGGKLANLLDMPHRMETLNQRVAGSSPATPTTD